jgi:Na+-transporting methylmalonyl-CoA/oxaloacetate decarboxylase gamma subunit
MAAINKYAGLIQIGITIVSLVFLAGATYRQSQDTEKRTIKCEAKIEKMAVDQITTANNIMSLVQRIEIAVAKLEERTSK